MSLSKETRERIEKESEAYVRGLSITHSKEHKRDGYNEGALHEAGRAQGLVDALEKLKEGSEGHTIRFIEQALAKYKEVSSEPG